MSAAIRFSPVGKVPGAPRFSEAYARLDSRGAQRAWGEGRPVCLFDDGSRRYGYLELLDAEDGGGTATLWGRYQIFGRPPAMPYSTGEFRFDLDRTAEGYRKLRWYFLCPECRARKGVLVFARGWACKRCHGLLARSQIVDPRVRMLEKADKLGKLVGKGRAKGMHMATFLRKREALRELSSKLRRLPIFVPSTEQARVVTSEWMTIDDARRCGIPVDGPWRS